MAEMNLAGRTALVTGASRGIGRGIAIGLAEAGADVAVNYTRGEDAAAETVAAIRALGRKAKAYQASVADEAACAVEEALAHQRGHRQRDDHHQDGEREADAGPREPAFAVERLQRASTDSACCGSSMCTMLLGTSVSPIR